MPGLITFNGGWALGAAAWPWLYLELLHSPRLHPQSSARDCFIILRFIDPTLCIIRSVQSIVSIVQNFPDFSKISPRNIAFRISCRLIFSTLKLDILLLCFVTVGSFSTKMLKIINFLIKQIEIKPFFHRNLSVSLILGFNSKFN